jgi:cystathionine gamma-synthase
VTIDDPDEVAAACVGADVLWIESPTNPAMEICDIAAAVAAARTNGVRTVCDNTFATPLLQQPLELGVDIVVHSATKMLAGHSDVLMGMAITKSDAIWTQLMRARTLALRLERSQANAMVLAERLVAHAAVTRVRYPGLPDDRGHAVAARQMSGFGSVLAFETVGGVDDAEAVCDAVRLITHATSLGGVETLIERRRRWPEERADIPENLLRLSVGIENVDDLWADLAGALDTITN